MKLHKLLAMVLALLLLSGAVPALAEAVDAERTGTLRILYPGTSGIEQTYMEKVKQAFQQKYPNVAVEIDYLVWTDLQTKFTIMAQNSDWPDIVTTQDFTSYLAMGILEPLNGYFDESLPLENFSGVGLEYTTVDGVIYAVPIGMNNWAHIANAGILEEIGWKAEDIRSWDDIVAIARAASEKGYYGYTCAGANGGRFLFRDLTMVALSNGFSPDDTSEETRPAYIETLQLFADLAPYMPEAQSTWGYDEQYRLFDEGRVAIMHAGTNYTSVAAPFGLHAINDVIPIGFPQGPSGTQPACMINSTALAIPTGSTQKDLAWAFIQTALSPECIDYYIASINMPPLKTHDQDALIAYADEEYFGHGAEHRALIDQFIALADECGLMQPKIVGQSPMELVVQAAMIDLLAGVTTPEACYEVIRTGIDDIKASLE
ncbi:MAG TPA: extracellular solute-binding protein [Candidatus Avichristensenella intestinipullorum]|uniref:Extracellular solute-binding protein n=1 Tax=Candidatus Avichristensenella intestinipullorum TaxID=2840693 RepID=A0A9D0YYD3_9FIRM|nr:extracellular solute-binding protein [Candidatus Avichristensenella intestinipullorum]